MKSAVVLSSLLPAVLAVPFPDCQNGPLANNTVCDVTASPPARAAALVAAMEIQEKLVNLVDKSKGAPRLGLPPYYWWSEALHGVANSPGVNWTANGSYSYATSFPMPITMSAAFDDDLLASVAAVISTEARAFSNAGRAGLDFWTPNINPYRDPRWGRGGETPGEDPRRIKAYIAALLAGLEEVDAATGTKKVIATCKHFAAYDLENWNGTTRYDFNAVVSTQDLVEYYLPPFQQCARDSHVGSIMCSYNAINGTPACANTYLMETVLRDHWGWTQDNNYITSDCDAVQTLYQGHDVVKTAAEAAGMAYTAGTDTACEYSSTTDVIGAYNQSLLPEAVINRALARLYEGLVRVGYFDGPNSTQYRSIDWTSVNTPTSQDLALQAATEGIVLKKNLNNLLPLPLTTNASAAVVGFWANDGKPMQGNYYGPAPFFITPALAARAVFSNVHIANGPISKTDAGTTASALDAANAADIVLYFGGNDGSIESEGNDRNSIAWPQAQLDLISQICALGKPCVVVGLGDQNDDTPLLQNKNVSALLWAGWPGQSGGQAVFDILYGVAAPAGRLPVTQYPASYVNEVPMTDMTLRPGPGNPGRTYMWYDKEVLPFGFGLHYTTFKARFGNTSTTYATTDFLAGCNSTSNPTPDTCLFAAVPVSVTNTGAVASDFVLLAFANGTAGPAPFPRKQLVSYTRLPDVLPGQTVETVLEVPVGEVARVDAQGNTVLYPGQYNWIIDVPTQDVVGFTITGEEVVLDRWPQPPANLGAAVPAPKA